MWDEIPIAGLLGTVKAVAMPGHDANLAIITDRGLFVATLDRKRKAVRVHGARWADSLFDTDSATFKWPKTEPVIGRCGKDNRLYTAETRRKHPSGQSLDPDPGTRRLLVRDPAGEIVHAVAEFPAGAAEWTAAGFSGCGRYLVAAFPGTVRAFRFVPAGERGIPLTAPSGGADDRTALLRAVLAVPDDDTPRLVYADWLDEHGDPARAEFIRLQCRIAEREQAAHVSWKDPDRIRERELEAKDRSRWQAELGSFRGLYWHEFRRGFPGLSVTSVVTLNRSAKMLAGVTPVEIVRVGIVTEDEARSFGRSPVFAGVRDLSVDYPTGADFVHDPLRVVLGSSHLAGLRVLRVGSLANGDSVAEAVAGAELPALYGLDLYFGTLTDRGALALARSPGLPRLAWIRCEKVVCTPTAKRKLRKRFPGMTL